MQKKHKKAKHGFIGPLGDDIPSIFPIVLGVILFMTTLIYINNAIGERNSDFNLRRAALSLGYISTQKGTYAINEFGALCNASMIPFANQQGLYFAVIMKRHCDKIDFGTNPYFSGYEQPTKNAGLCTNALEEKSKIQWSALTDSNNPSTDLLSTAQNYGPKDTVILNYPIAVPCPEETNVTLGLGMMNVIVWPKK